MTFKFFVTETYEND